MTHEIELATIRENPRPVRGIDETAVARLVDSIGLVGQLEPIVLTTDRVLVFGRQRIAAQRARGETTIMATIVDLPDTQARIATLDENLCRLELTPLQRGELLAERKDLHEQLHPGSRHGAGPKGEGSAPGFTRTMAELTGRGRSTVAEDCRIGAMPESVRQLIRGTSLERGKAVLLELAKLPGEAEQLRACEALLNGPAPDVVTVGSVAPDPGSEGPEPATAEDTVAYSDELQQVQGATRCTAKLVENALEPLEDWLNAVETSPEVENRFVHAAVALSGYAVTLLERVASGIETCGETSVYAKRVRRSARALARRAQEMADELMLVTECTCADGCSACGFARGFAAVALNTGWSKASGET